jgi:hypothetical protein
VTGPDDATCKRPHSHVSQCSDLGSHPSTRKSYDMTLAVFPFHRPREIPHHSIPLHHSTRYSCTTQLSYTTSLPTSITHHPTLAMSDSFLDLFLDPPKVASYRINPNKQCGVVKHGGNRCTTQLSCRIHGEDEKRAVNRSTTYEKLLSKQLASNALSSTHHTGRPGLAPVFDPDTQCGVELPVGEPCTEDFMFCEAHTPKQQPTVPGRSVRLDDLQRVDNATSSRLMWEIGDIAFQYNPNTYCGVKNTDGSHCQCMLSCMRHTAKDKREVLRDPPFQHKFTTLLRLQNSRITIKELEDPWSQPWWDKGAARRQEAQENHILSEHDEDQQASFVEGCTTIDEMDLCYSDDVPPVTPDRPSCGNTDTASQKQTPKAPSPRAPRGSVSPLSWDTSDDEQFTPTSSRDGFESDSDEEEHGDTVEGSRADLDAQEAQLERDWAQLHQVQARQERRKARLHDEEVTTCQGWEQVCRGQARQHRLELQLLQDQAIHEREKAQLSHDQDKKQIRALQRRDDQAMERLRNAELRYDELAASFDRHNDQSTEEIGNAQLRYDNLSASFDSLLASNDHDSASNDRLSASFDLLNDQSTKRLHNAELRYDQVVATLDRRVHEQQATDLEVKRLRERAQRVDELEQALDVQRSEKASMLQSIEDLKLELKTPPKAPIAQQSRAESTSTMTAREKQNAFKEQVRKTLAEQNVKAAKEAEINKLQEEINAMFQQNTRWGMK